MTTYSHHVGSNTGILEMDNKCFDNKINQHQSYPYRNLTANWCQWAWFWQQLIILFMTLSEYSQVWIPFQSHMLQHQFLIYNNYALNQLNPCSFRERACHFSSLWTNRSGICHSHLRIIHCKQDTVSLVPSLSQFFNVFHTLKNWERLGMTLRYSCFVPFSSIQQHMICRNIGHRLRQ